MHYYVNGTEVDYNQVVSTTNPFEYKITLANDDFCCDKTVLVIQTMSHKFDILSSNQTYSKVSGSVQDQYVFDPIVVPKNSGQQIILNFQNTAPVSVRTEPFTTSMEDAQGFEYNFQLFLVRLDVPAIPEFPLVALPIGIVLGSFFIISRRKK
jgi:hypothetical protein